MENKLFQKLNLLKDKVKELDKKGEKKIYECNTNKDETKKIETTTHGLQTENVDDTASHAKENQGDICRKDFKSKSILLNHDKKFHILKEARTFSSMTNVRRKRMMKLNY